MRLGKAGQLAGVDGTVSDIPMHDCHLMGMILICFLPGTIAIAV